MKSALLTTILALFTITAQAEDAAQAFRAECGKMAAEAEAADGITVPGSDGWLFLARELRHISVGQFWGDKAAEVSRATNPDQQDPLPAIVDYNEQLKKLGIELILVPVPPKAIVYPDKLAAAAAPPEGQPPARLDSAHREFYKLLREKGVNVIDLTEEFLPLRLLPQDDKNKIYCQGDTHWSGLACVRTAQLIAKELKTRPWYNNIERQTIEMVERSVQINGDLAREMPTKPAPEKLHLRFVGTQQAGLPKPLPPDEASPVILLGDSHTLVFHSGGDMHTTGAGLADQLAYELGFPVDLIGVRGSGARPARVNLYRRGRRNADYFTGKKALIWCFSAREFTESSGWGIVPVTR